MAQVRVRVKLRVQPLRVRLQQGRVEEQAEQRRGHQWDGLRDGRRSGRGVVRLRRHRGGQLRRELRQGLRRWRQGRPVRRLSFFTIALGTAAAVVVFVVVVVVVVDGRRRSIVYRRNLLGPVVPVSLVVMVMVVMVPLVSAARDSGQQAPVTPDPCSVASGRRALRAHVHADRS